MKLKITHITKYNYQDPVMESANEVCLTPLTDHRQSCEHFSVLIEPQVPLYTYKDYFGNVIYHFTIQEPHQRLLIKTESVVETKLPDNSEKSKVSFEVELDILAKDSFQNQYAEYLMETPYTKGPPELKGFIDDTIKLKRSTSIYQFLRQISEAIHTNFIYDKSATNVHTTVEKTLRLKRGVCQDYAHLMIAICRTFNIPSRYVSGYHFIGDIEGNNPDFQHASHAWVEAYVPAVGWFGFDPTNHGEVDFRYVKIGHGRNYSDVVPVKGVYIGSTQQQLKVNVEIQKFGEEVNFR